MSRALRPLAALALFAVIVAGCGNGSAGTSDGTATNGGTTSIHGKAVKFAECMRTNGVTAFPDPTASGELTIDAIANGSSVNTSSPAFEQALIACKNLEPSGFTGQTRTPEQQKGALEFAQCMRDNGVPDFPDPDPNGPLVDTNRIPSAAAAGGMSILNATMRTCSRYAAAAGVQGSR